jgi:hypothetical protein
MKRFRAIFTLFASLLVLVSSTSFTVGVHWCDGAVKEVAFLKQADGCGHQQMPPCHRKLMQDCCDDEKVEHDALGFDDTVSAVRIISLSDGFMTLPGDVIVALIIPEGFRGGNRIVDYYDVPIRSFDRNVVHHVFLI